MTAPTPREGLTQGELLDLFDRTAMYPGEGGLLVSEITVILGPVVCQTCREPVVWGTADVRGSHGKVNRWRDPATGHIHKCKRENNP